MADHQNFSISSHPCHTFSVPFQEEAEPASPPKMEIEILDDSSDEDEDDDEEDEDEEEKAEGVDVNKVDSSTPGLVTASEKVSFLALNLSLYIIRFIFFSLDSLCPLCLYLSIYLS